jgi:hypothetical protein
MVDKVLSYDQLKLLSLTGSSCSENGDGGLADWRTHVLFASDDQEGEGYEGIIHMSQSDGLARRVEDEYPELNVSKIYLDAYQQISTPVESATLRLPPNYRIVWIRGYWW